MWEKNARLHSGSAFFAKPVSFLHFISLTFNLRTFLAASPYKCLRFGENDTFISLETENILARFVCWTFDKCFEITQIICFSLCWHFIPNFCFKIKVSLSDLKKRKKKKRKKFFFGFWRRKGRNFEAAELKL